MSTDFAGGITAIVGPNGCGKSNLSEAITWVLGEQSAKSLRGGRMEDVIFSGSEQRKPLGMAEVNIALWVGPSHPEAREGKIIIGRRVFRGGESQYRLNDKITRLKEIKDLLADTGLGVRAYSVIEQGRIGQILSTKPQDRRRLIEEAAGVTRYKQRKRLAELKLEEATANRMRLDDIIAEVERALRSLKRQSNAARRFKKREGRYRELLNRVLRARWSRLQHGLDALRRDLEQAGDCDGALAAELARAEAALAEERERLEQMGEELADLRSRAAEHSATIEGRQELLKGARRTLEEVRERLANGKTVAAQRHQELDAHLQALKKLDAREHELLTERDRAKSAFDADRDRVREAEEALVERVAEQDRLRGELMSAIAELNALQSHHHKLQIEREKADYRSHHLGVELETCEQELTQAESGLEAAGSRVEELVAQIADGERSRQDLRDELDRLLQSEADRSQKRRDCEERKALLRQRRELLEELAEEDESRRAFLRDALAELGAGDVRFLDDEAEVPAGWEESLDLFLAQLLDAVLLPAGVDAVELARDLAERGCDATLLQSSPNDGTRPEDWLRRAAPEIGERRGLWAALLRPFRRRRAVSGGSGNANGNGHDPDLDAVVTSLGQALGLAPEHANSLPPAFLVSSAEAAERLARRHPGVAFLAGGEQTSTRLWAQNGVLHVQSEAAGPGSLSRQREMQTIAEELPELEALSDELERELTQLVERRTASAAAANRLEATIAEHKQELAVARARRQDALRQRDRCDEQRRHLLADREAIDEEIARLERESANLGERIQAAEDEHRQVSGQVERAESAVAEARARRENTKTESAGREGQLRLVVERLDSHNAEVVRLRQQCHDTRSQIARWAQEESGLVRRIDELEATMRRAERELQEALEARSRSQDEQTGQQERMTEQREAVRRSEEQVSQLRARRDEQRSQIEELRITQAQQKQEASHLEDDFRDEFASELPAERDQLDEIPHNLAELESELLEVRTRIERMGPVNVLAAEEYAEQEERHTFLVTQREDLQRSIDSLRQTIREINATSTERFLAAFNEVNESFARTFSELFRGGEASMRLLDDDDPLDSGLEIVARPPGKRLQNIQLLSGGEKALTAIALLFALFRTKPSPFCILDEVDAPLDDANILRFVEMLRQMSNQTQFIIITHNKLTMESAGALYGVTMEEKGVSKLVGVNIDDLHPESAIA